MNRLKLGPIHKIRPDSPLGGLPRDSEVHPTHVLFSAAWVPFPVLSAVLGAAICRSTPLYAGR